MDILCFVVPFAKLCDAELSVATEVDGCGRPISAMPVCMDIGFWKCSNSSSTSDFMAKAMKFFRMLHYTCMGPSY